MHWSEPDLMAPRLTTRLERKRASGFGRHTAGASTPISALTSDVCPSWPGAAAMQPRVADVAFQRDRQDVGQGSTRSNIGKRSIVNGLGYSPSRQSQSRIGAGTEGGGRT
jgi:hypothetical protein